MKSSQRDHLLQDGKPARCCKNIPAMGVGQWVWGAVRARDACAPRAYLHRGADVDQPASLAADVKLPLMRAGAHPPNTRRVLPAIAGVGSTTTTTRALGGLRERTAALNTASASLFFPPGGGAGSGGGAVPRLSQVDLPAELAPSALVSGRQSRPGAHASAAVSVFDCVVKLGYIDATQRARRCRERRRSRTQAQPGLRGCIIGRGGVPPACLPPLEGMSGTVPGYRWTYYIIIMYGRARACAC